jgi:hypothetical protein
LDTSKNVGEEDLLACLELTKFKKITLHTKIKKAEYHNNIQFLEVEMKNGVVATIISFTL